MRTSWSGSPDATDTPTPVPSPEAASRRTDPTAATTRCAPAHVQRDNGCASISSSRPEVSSVRMRSTDEITKPPAIIAPSTIV